MKTTILLSIVFIIPNCFLQIDKCFAQAGSLDNTFGSGGIVTTAVGNDLDESHSVAIQSDGKIVVAGYTRNGNYNDFAVVRYNSNGTLDNTFGSGGIVITTFGNYHNEGYSVAIQPDGKIVVAGSSNTDFTVVRYNSDGSLDTNFDVDGIVTTDFAGGFDYGYSIAIQPDGKIVVAGCSANLTGNDFALVRYNSDGSLDSTFNVDGKVTTTIGAEACINSVAIQPDGKIIVAGYSWTLYSTFAIARYTSNGYLDTTFDTDGIVITSLGEDNGRSLALQPDGKIVVAGSTYNAANNSIEWSVIRYNNDGLIDSTFDFDGIVTTVIFAMDAANSVLVQPDGKIVVAGFAAVVPFVNADVAIVRYNSDGTQDNTFGVNGMVTTPVGIYGDAGRSLALQPDGKLVVTGYTNNGNNNDFLVIRYNGDVNTAIEAAEVSIDLIDIYPNPFANEMIIKSKGSGNLFIYDVSGKEILHQTISKGDTNINTEEFSKGSYIIHYADGIANKHLLLIKQ